MLPCSAKSCTPPSDAYVISRCLTLLAAILVTVSPENDVADHAVGLLSIIETEAGDLRRHKQGDAVWARLCEKEHA